MTTDATDRLLEIVLLERRLDALGGPEADGELFERLLREQDQLLADFGLPPAQEYLELLSIDPHWQLQPAQIRAKVAVLANAGRQHARVKASKTDFELLRLSAIKCTDPFDALPKIGITPHQYQLFLYEQIDTARDDVMAGLLEEMQAAEPLLDQIAIVRSSGDDADHDDYCMLKQRLPHFEDFFTHREEEDEEWDEEEDWGPELA